MFSSYIITLQSLQPPSRVLLLTHVPAIGGYVGSSARSLSAKARGASLKPV
jgi:hypothetical protein